MAMLKECIVFAASDVTRKYYRIAILSLGYLLEHTFELAVGAPGY
jgi:hypothetical protein